MPKTFHTYIIDDDPVFIFGLKFLLNMENFAQQIKTFPNGEEAIAELQKTKKLPEIIFLDLNMPVMDGWEFLDWFVLQEKLAPIAIYVTSSSIDPRDLDRVKKYGSKIRGYLYKPLHKEQIDNIRKQVEE